MIKNRYILTCHECNTVFSFRTAETQRAFAKDHDGRCPCCCGEYLSQVPISRMALTTPPELKRYPVYMREVDVDASHNLLDFRKWPSK